MKDFKRIVVKVGTHNICGADGAPSIENIKRLGSQLLTLIHSGFEVVLVSSGSVASGANLLLKSQKPNTLALKQACASVGQPVLMAFYRHFFEPLGLQVGQILLTGDIIASRERYINARNTFFELLKKRVLPIVNENDSVSVDEIKFGDNDNLAVNVAAITEADGVFILTDTDGLYADFGTEKQTLLQNIKGITEEIESLVVDTKGHFSTGGMWSKIKAAEKAHLLGIPLIIVNGKKENILLEYLLDKKQPGTTFWPQEKIRSRKKWLYLHFLESGKIYIDEGAKNALLSGKSLLSVGIKSVEGNFNKGDMVEVLFEDKKIGKGLVNYSAKSLSAICGIPSDLIVEKLGFENGKESIHRDNFILIATEDD